MATMEEHAKSVHSAGSLKAVSSTQKTNQSTDPSTAPSCDYDPSADFHGDLAVADDIPSQETLDEAANLLVLDADGSSRPFRTLYSGEGVAHRVLVVFVRHFFCGNCQEYLRTLTSSITPDSLLSLPTPTFITVIGCGRPELIPMYTEATQCPFPIYADPTRKLYDLLGMSRTLNLGKKPDYMRNSLLLNGVKSLIQGLRSGTGATKGGDIKQVGGEFMFDEGKVVWCHRMKNTRDHSEVPELRRVIGLEKAASGEETKDSLRGKVSKVVGTRSGDWAKKEENGEKKEDAADSRKSTETASRTTTDQVDLAEKSEGGSSQQTSNGKPADGAHATGV